MMTKAIMLAMVMMARTSVPRKNCSVTRARAGPGLDRSASLLDENPVQTGNDQCGQSRYSDSEVAIAEVE